MPTLFVVHVGTETYFRFHNPLPALARELPHNGDEAERELDQRVRQRFPVGSAASALVAELEKEGWGPVQTYRDEQYVSFARAANLLIEEKATIVWKSDQAARIIEVQGHYALTGP